MHRTRGNIKVEIEEKEFKKGKGVAFGSAIFLDPPPKPKAASDFMPYCATEAATFVHEMLLTANVEVQGREAALPPRSVPWNALLAQVGLRCDIACIGPVDVSRPLDDALLQ